MKKDKLFFVDNDAIFYYFFRNNLYLFKTLISHIFKVKIKHIEWIRLLNNKPYLDEVYNKYNVLYLQIKISNKYYYLIINNVNKDRSTKYSENYMLNIELMKKYRKTYILNKGEIRNVYFVFSKEDWIKRIMVWTDNGMIINSDFKYIFNINNKNNYLVKDIKRILDIISINNEHQLNEQGKEFRTKYNIIFSSIKQNILEEANILKKKRIKLILDYKHN